MQNDKIDAQKRLDEACKLTGLDHTTKEILCDIISAEISDSLAGSYSDIPISVYHHPLCSGYSSTTIKRMVEQTFNHWFVSKDEESKALRFGTAFHAFCNEPHIFERDYLIVPTDDKKSAEWRAAKKTVTQKILITQSEFNAIQVMSRKLFEHPDAGPLLKGAQNEITFFSKDSKTGLWKKCRVDSLKGMAVSDLKSTRNASEGAFAYDSKKYLYRISASYYLEIISEVNRRQYKDFFLIPCETVEPHECAVYRVSDFSLEKSQDEIRQALGTIRRVLDEGESAWRGYQLGIRELAI